LGHVGRCLALAEALRECGFPCLFRGRYSAGADEMLSSADMPFDQQSASIGGPEDLDATLENVRTRRFVATVVDSYEVDESYLSALDDRAGPLLFLDDFNRLARYDCAAILNCTVDAPQLRYPPGKAELLLGVDYFLARRRLRQLRRAARPRSGAFRKVLVAIGGVDRHDLTLLVVSTLLEVAPQLSLRVVVGRSHRRVGELALLTAKFAGGGRVEAQLPDLGEPLVWADLCVCGGGLTKYEAAYLGTPAAVLSQNRAQADETLHFCRRGLAADLGLWEEIDGAHLAGRLSDLLDDSFAGQALSARGLDYFPADPTRHAAERFAAIIDGSGR
jgi:spore coat polysaccharide biosynthesis predicted glycosyltransferase SpsG